MRTVFIFLSVIVFLTLIPYSNGNPRRVRSLENDENYNMMKKIVHKLKPYINEDSLVESDESNEEEKVKVVDAIEFQEESSSDSNEQEKDEEDNDTKAILSHFIGIDHENMSQNSDEN